MDATLSSDEPIPSDRPCIISQGPLTGLSVIRTGAIASGWQRVRCQDLAGVYLEIRDKPSIVRRLAADVASVPTFHH